MAQGGAITVGSGLGVAHQAEPIRRPSIKWSQAMAMAIASLRCAGAEQGLAVVAAEQEGEPVQVLAQFADG